MSLFLTGVFTANIIIVVNQGYLYGSRTDPRMPQHHGKDEETMHLRALTGNPTVYVVTKCVFLVLNVCAIVAYISAISMFIITKRKASKNDLKHTNPLPSCLS